MIQVPGHASILRAKSEKALDLIRLGQLEQAFRTWAGAAPGKGRQVSRLRILLVFLIIRYTGARLNEVLTLDVSDVDLEGGRIRFRKDDREVQIPEHLVDELRAALPLLGRSGDVLHVDAAHVRRRCYDRAQDAGIPRELGTPEVIRKSRAVELMQSNMPLPVVQRIMGHSTPGLAASYVHFSAEDIRRVERFHLERENKHKTSARNRFYGKIEKVHIGDIQARVELAAVDGHRVTAVITTHSRKQLGLKPGTLIAAEVKAPWVVIYKGEEAPTCTAENQYNGTVSRVSNGKINSEIVVRISDTTELCSILTEKSRHHLRIKEGDTVWAVFSAAAVVLHVD
jgi:molybdate transport system regulatory protein